MSTSYHKQIVRRYFDEIINAGKIETADEILSGSVVYVTPTTIARGVAGFKSALREGLRGFPDLHATVQTLVAESEHVMCRLTLRGTYAGPYSVGQPTGRKFVLPVVMHFQFASARIGDIEVLYDTRVLAEQLGTPLPPVREI